VEDVDVEVDNIELIDPAADLVQHDHVIGQSVSHRGIKAQGHIAAANEISRCFGVAACEKPNGTIAKGAELQKFDRNQNSDVFLIKLAAAGGLRIPTWSEVLALPDALAAAVLLPKGEE
jgi:hypothetical protein